jgi:phosphoglycerol transferase MdoB-like AlkP superfamily enzyme
MKTVEINKRKMIPYGILAVVLYALLGIAYAMRGLDNFPTSSLPSLLIMPLAIFFVGILNIKISKRLQIIFTVLLLIYIPTHIVTFVLGDYHIELLIRFFINSLIVFAVFMLVMAIFLDVKTVTIICCIMAFLILTANTYVIAFRGLAITPGDIMAAKTAFKVAGGYEYFINPAMVSSIMYSIIIVQLISKLCITLRGISIGKKVALRLACLVASVCSAVGVYSLIDVGVSYETMAYNAFDTAMTNQKLGTLLTFVTNVTRCAMDAPDGYNAEAADKLLKSVKVEQPKEAAVKEPNIIVIMNEAFCDIDKVYKINPSEDPLKYWHSLTENTVSGDMMVSVKGGGTSYTEFEFLTGLAGGIIPIHKTPYLDYINKNTHSLAWDLKQAGYTNIATHPFWGSCWNREVVYPLLGFDDFISGEDYSKEQKDTKDYNKIDGKHITTHTDLGDDLEYVREYISDRESYNKVIEQFENKSEGEKLFVFDVTVQNHSGFKYKGDDFTTDVTADNDESGELCQYLSLLKQTDIAYSELIEYFKSYDEPTVILMFGDHQPALDGTSYNTDENTRDEYLAYTEGGAGLQRYIVPYKLWANYDIGTTECNITGSSYLSLMLKSVAGIEYNSWDAFRLSMESAFDAVTLRGYLTETATKPYTTGKDAEKDELIEQYEQLEYYLLREQGLMSDYGK